MSTLNLALLGPFEGSVNGIPLVKFRTARAQALLVYLATEFALGTSHHGRESLMELLWPGMPPDSARTNLRQNLYYLRQAIANSPAPDGGKAIPLLLSDRQSVAVNADYPLEFDVQCFISLLAGSQGEWAQAIDLYRGEFLSDFYLPDANPFEEWAAARREAFRRRALDALQTLTDSFVSQGMLKDGERYARQQLAIDPLRETAYRQLMKVLYWSGRRAEALKLYLECVRILRDELDARPSEATEAVAQSIREGTLAGQPKMTEQAVNADLEISIGMVEAAGTHKQKSDSAPRVEQVSPVRHNLPVAMTPFVGREEEVAELTRLITDPEVHIITLLGPGGIGKTRLALEVASRQRLPSSPFPDGVFFVSLAPVESADEIETTLASSLSISFQPASQATHSEREQILEHLARKKMLLVMDNFEHVLEGRALLAEINNQTTGVKLLVTSRERLQMRGEQVFPLYGLEMPQADDIAKEASADYAAGQLFLNICRQTTPDFELYEGDAEQMHRICRLVEGMPLGLELAASWTGLLPLSKIAEEIEQSLQLLSTEYHDIPRRHRSMQATLDVSWKRLTDEQKSAFQGLAIFRGGFTRSAALEVADANLAELVALVNKSWLSYERKNDRYQIHELLRQYGMSKLKVETALEQAMRARHSAYFCGFLKERETDWFGAKQQEATAEVRVEIENIQSAWRWAAGQADARMLVKASKSLGRFYSREMRRTEGQRSFGLAADALSKVLIQQESDDPQSLTLWSQILTWQAEFTDKLDQKQKLLSQSQDILDRVTVTGQDTRAEQAFIYLEQAYATGKRDYKAAVSFSNLALELFRELGDRKGEAEALKELGLSYRRLGKAKQALEALRENLEIRQQLDDPFGIADAMQWLGVALTAQMKLKEAERLNRQALALFRQLGSRYYEAQVLMNLSFTQQNTGETLAARELIDQALVLERDFGLPVNLWLHSASAANNMHLGRYAEAKANASYFLDIARQRGLSEETGAGLDVLGGIAIAQGDLEQARSYLRESIAVYREALDVREFSPQAGLGYIARVEGDDSLARKCLSDNLCATKDYDHAELAVDWLPLAALLAADDGRPELSIELYSLARHIGFIKNSRYWQEIACRELDAVRDSLRPEVALAAEKRGRELDLRETVEVLLVWLSRLTAA